MAFKVLDEFLGDSLDLPVRCTDGAVRTFTIPACSAEDGIRVERLMEAGLRMAADGADPTAEVLDDAAEMDLYRVALGTAYDDLLAHLAWPRFRHVALTVTLWITQGREAAEAFWEADGDPQQAPNRAERRSSSRAAKSTPKRGSQSGTSTPRATSRARKAAKT